MLGYNEIQAEFNIKTTLNQCDSGWISISFQEYQVGLCKEHNLYLPAQAPCFCTVGADGSSSGPSFTRGGMAPAEIYSDYLTQLPAAELLPAEAFLSHQLYSSKLGSSVIFALFIPFQLSLSYPDAILLMNTYVLSSTLSSICERSAHKKTSVTL